MTYEKEYKIELFRLICALVFGIFGLTMKKKKKKWREVLCCRQKYCQIYENYYYKGNRAYKIFHDADKFFVVSFFVNGSKKLDFSFEFSEVLITNMASVVLSYFPCNVVLLQLLIFLLLLRFKKVVLISLMR